LGKGGGGEAGGPCPAKRLKDLYNEYRIIVVGAAPSSQKVFSNGLWNLVMGDGGYGGWRVAPGF
jgi:hypothetical protein